MITHRSPAAEMHIRGPVDEHLQSTELLQTPGRTRPAARRRHDAGYRDGIAELRFSTI
jgi:hypothetical protein